MKLSVIIVNYNVRYFLEQCLHSVMKASAGLPTEIFVVDNHSVDGSVGMVREKFPEVILKVNTVNKGFSKANNQAISKAKGEYILLLNPDTVVEEDTFRKVVEFMDTHPDAGGLGVKMIDGKGNFLPESKRGFPSPWVAFYKIFGLSKMFPKSRRFGQYHLSYLPENETNQVDVLAGAFMLLRSSVLRKTGLLDEDFFMYGEDIDLSYRIVQAGYHNYYFPGTTIIHYKGESTKKGSINYVRMFYTAMLIFAGKHFSKGRALGFSLLINLAIRFRATLSVISRLVSWIFIPLMDAFIIFSGFLFLVPFWETMKFETGYYPPVFLKLVVPVYVLFWLAGVWSSGGYRKPVSLFRLARGLFWGTIAILLAYSMASEEFRFSRVLILMGSVWAVVSLLIFRLILSRLKIKGFDLKFVKRKRTAILGQRGEVERVRELLAQSSSTSDVVGYVSVGESETGPLFIGHSGELEEIIRINRIDEIIFCAGNISSATIIQFMLRLSGMDLEYKIAPPESFSIIGSNSIHTAGDLYVVNVNAISKSFNQRLKRIIDLKLSFLMILASPLILWAYSSKKRYYGNLFRILSGKWSFVGYIPGDHFNDELPYLKKGLLNPGDLFPDLNLTPERNQQLNILYAKDYKLLNDLEIIFKNWRQLDR